MVLMFLGGVNEFSVLSVFCRSSGQPIEDGLASIKLTSPTYCTASRSSCTSSGFAREPTDCIISWAWTSIKRMM